MPASTMKTIEICEFGTPDVLEQGTRKRPEVKPGHVLVKVTAAGVNGPDIVQRRGHYPPPPGASDLLGLEVSGEIIQVGEGVSQWSIGDKICALTNGGGYAEYVAVDAAHCLPVPESVDEIDAAGLPETYFTVWSNFFFKREINKGDIFLVHGGTGGIGSTAIQLGNALGMRVFTTCGSAENCAFAEEMGAERGINYNDEDFVEIVKEAGGANMILDIIGGDYIDRNIKAAAPDALIVQLAFNKGAKAEVNLMPVMLKRLTITGSTLRPRSPEFKAAIATDLREKVWPLFANGKLKTNTFKVFPFEDVVAAHELMEAKGHQGKILIRP